MEYWFYCDVQKTNGLTIPVVCGDYISKGQLTTSASAQNLIAAPAGARYVVVLPAAQVRIRVGQAATVTDQPYFAGVKDYIGIMPDDVLSVIEG